MAGEYGAEGMLEMYLYENGQLLEKLEELVLEEKDEEFISLSIGSSAESFVPSCIYPLKVEIKDTGDGITKNELDINVSGLKDIKVNISSCCNPIPGDEIVGYITKNNGITIHRKSCDNLIHLEDRMVEVKFNAITKNKYLTTILITMKNNQNKLFIQKYI